jgi:beta-glucanase (GH16 family)
MAVQALARLLSLAALLLGAAGDLDAPWLLVFEDDFDAPALNASAWRVADNKTHGDREPQLYTADNVYVEAGNLVVRTQVRDAPYGPNKTYHFTSGWVDTAGLVEVAYGRLEARIKAPKELANLWPTFWLINDLFPWCWPWGGEIDILERVGGFRNDSVFATYHWGSQCNVDEWEGDLKSGQVAPPPGEQWSDAFHVFALFTNKTMMTWAVDGVPYVSRTAGEPASLFVPAWPLYAIFNVAISPYVGPQPTPTEGFPSFMLVDRVSWYVWGVNSTAGEFPIPVGPPPAY